MPTNPAISQCLIAAITTDANVLPKPHQHAAISIFDCLTSEEETTSVSSEINENEIFQFSSGSSKSHCFGDKSLSAFISNSTSNDSHNYSLPSIPTINLPKRCKKRKHTDLSDQVKPTSSKQPTPSNFPPFNDVTSPQKLIASLMTEVNKGDASALKALILTNCDQSVEFTLQYKNGSEPCPYSKSTLTEVHGVQAFALFCENLLVAIPDTRMITQEMSCRFQANNGCIVSTCRYAFTGTKTLSLISDEHNCMIKSAENDHHSDYICAYHNTANSNIHGKIHQSTLFHEGRLIVGVNTHPQSLRLFGTFQLTINPLTGLISKVYITHSHKKRWIIR